MATLLGKFTAASFGLATLALAATGAQAAVVCNSDGDCWRTHETYTYPPAAGVVIHPDTWSWSGDKYRWREHEGRGYWHSNNWVEF